MHVSELDVGIKPAGELTRSMDEIKADIRTRLVCPGGDRNRPADFTASTTCCQVRLRRSPSSRCPATNWTLRSQPNAARPAGHRAGLADLQVEKQVLSPQIRIRVDYAAAARYGVPAPQILAMLQGLIEGEQAAQIVEGKPAVCPVLRLPDTARTLEGLGRIQFSTPHGSVPLTRPPASKTATAPTRSASEGGTDRPVGQRPWPRLVRHRRRHPPHRRRCPAAGRFPLPSVASSVRRNRRRQLPCCRSSRWC